MKLPVALTATIFNIDIDLSDSDRGVYESLPLRIARHPSESDEYLLTRVLAYALEYAEGIEFSKGGLSDAEAPPIAVRDLTGRYLSWIEVGLPDAAKLHRAAKAAPRVAVYVHRDPAQWLQRLEGERIHRAADLELYAIDLALIDALVARLERRMAFSLAVNDRELYLSFDNETLSGAVRRLSRSAA